MNIDLINNVNNVKFYERKDFNQYKSQCTPIIQTKDIKTGLIKFYDLSVDRDFLVGDRLDRLFTSSVLKDSRSGTVIPIWSAIDKKLSRSIHLGHREISKKQHLENDISNSTSTVSPFMRYNNADNRLAYCWQSCFLVRQNFTFGMAKPDAGQIHLIRTFHTPMLIFCLPENKTTSQLIEAGFFKAGFFSASKQNFFDVYVLKEHSTYLIPSNMIYVLLSVQKTFFTFHKCAAAVARDLRYGEHKMKFCKPNGESQRLSYTCSMKTSKKRGVKRSFVEKGLPIPTIFDPLLKRTDAVVSTMVLPTQIKRKRGRPRLTNTAAVASTSSSTKNMLVEEDFIPFIPQEVQNVFENVGPMEPTNMELLTNQCQPSMSTNQCQPSMSTNQCQPSMSTNQCQPSMSTNQCQPSMSPEESLTLLTGSDVDSWFNSWCDPVTNCFDTYAKYTTPTETIMVKEPNVFNFVDPLNEPLETTTDLSQHNISNFINSFFENYCEDEFATTNPTESTTITVEQHQEPDPTISEEPFPVLTFQDLDSYDMDSSFLHWLDPDEIKDF